MASAYRRDIDGLRGVAVLSVIFFHAASAIFPGGYIGVDIFFVISGFVISASIYDGIVDKTFSYAEFYARRARRILPVAIVTILVTLLISYLIYYPPAIKDVLLSGLAAMLSYSNFFFWKTTNYFAADALLRPLLHTWSLSVEEQFYVFLPPFLFFATRFRRSITLMWIVAVAAASFALSFYLMDRGPTANFYLPLTRAWELLLGVFVAVSPKISASSRLGYIVYFLAACGLIGPIFLYSESTPFPGYGALVPCLATALIIYVNPINHPIRRILESRPMVFVGLISYSLYLVHWPIIVFASYLKLDHLSTLQALCVITVSIALATASWKFIEQPFRHLSLAGSGKFKILGGAAAALCISAALSSIGYAYRFEAGIASPTSIESPKVAHTDWRQGRCFLIGDFDPSKWSEPDCRLSLGVESKALLWGDSLAAHYVPGLKANAAMLKASVYQYTMAGCPPVLSYFSYARHSCSSFNQNALNVIDHGKFDTVILSARWIDLRTRGLDQLAGTIDELKKRKLKIYIIGQSPIYLIDVQAIYYLKGEMLQDASWKSAIKPDLNEKIRAVVASMADPNIVFVDPTARICSPTLDCPYLKNGKFLFFDSAHFTDFGSSIMVRSYFPLRD